MEYLDSDGNLGVVSISFFGRKVAESVTEGFHEVGCTTCYLPASINFNSNWIVCHTCALCGEVVSFGEDYEKQTKDFTELINLPEDVLRLFVRTFRDLEIYYHDGRIYLNRRSFNYEYQMQRLANVVP